ncbi:MAG: flagellar export chaperone FliS [Firmicutes bacterium]|nr:flagellar export chaperone FliS [Bacillota bacterium]
MQPAFNPYQQYLQSAVLTAEPGQLTLMLYRGAGKFVRQAKDRLAARDIPGAHEAIVRAQDILVYLMETVNPEMEIGKNLFALYEYMHRRLVEANMKKDAAVLQEVAGFLEELAGTWAEALKQGGAGTHSAAVSAGAGAR